MKLQHILRNNNAPRFPKSFVFFQGQWFKHGTQQSVQKIPPPPQPLYRERFFNTSKSSIFLVIQWGHLHPSSIRPKEFLVTTPNINYRFQMIYPGFQIHIVFDSNFFKIHDTRGTKKWKAKSSCNFFAMSSYSENLKNGCHAHSSYPHSPRISYHKNIDIRVSIWGVHGEAIADCYHSKSGDPWYGSEVFLSSLKELDFGFGGFGFDSKESCKCIGHIFEFYHTDKVGYFNMHHLVSSNQSTNCSPVPKCKLSLPKMEAEKRHLPITNFQIIETRTFVLLGQHLCISRAKFAIISMFWGPVTITIIHEFDLALSPFWCLFFGRLFL